MFLKNYGSPFGGGVDGKGHGRGLGGVVVIDAAIGAHGRGSRPAHYTLLHRCSDLGQVVNLSLSVA